MLRQIFVITMEGHHLWRWELQYFKLTVIIPSPYWHHKGGGGGGIGGRHHWIKRMWKTLRGWSLYSLVYLLTELGQAACFWMFFLFNECMSQAVKVFWSIIWSPSSCLASTVSPSCSLYNHKWLWKGKGAFYFGEAVEENNSWCSVTYCLQHPHHFRVLIIWLMSHNFEFSITGSWMPVRGVC